VLPPTNDHPADMLRWVRRLNVAMLGVGVLVALLLWPMWWFGAGIAVLALLSLATIGSAIERAEAHGPNDPATRPERRRRAERVTYGVFGAFGLIVAVIGLFVEGPLFAVVLLVVVGLSIGGAIGISRRVNP
jgi:hypothetical protein